MAFWNFKRKLPVTFLSYKLRTGGVQMTKYDYRRVMPADQLEDMNVYNVEGEKLGEIEDIMIDTKSGKVAYAVLDFKTGFLKMKDKLFAVPWQAIDLDIEHGRFNVKVNKETLKNAPGFDPNDWPDMADPIFRERVYSHYGYDTDLSEVTVTSTETGTPRSTPTGTRH